MFSEIYLGCNFAYYEKDEIMSLTNNFKDKSTQGFWDRHMTQRLCAKMDKALEIGPQDAWHSGNDGVMLDMHPPHVKRAFRSALNDLVGYLASHPENTTIANKILDATESAVGRCAKNKADAYGALARSLNDVLYDRVELALQKKGLHHREDRYWQTEFYLYDNNPEHCIGLSRLDLEDKSPQLKTFNELRRELSTRWQASIQNDIAAGKADKDGNIYAMNMSIYDLERELAPSLAADVAESTLDNHTDKMTPKDRSYAIYNLNKFGNDAQKAKAKALAADLVANMPISAAWNEQRETLIGIANLPVPQKNEENYWKIRDSQMKLAGFE